jgi:hypothetical protein
MANPLKGGSGGNEAAPRYAYGTQEFLDWHNSRRTRREPDGSFSLEWFYDSKGDARLRYVKTGVRVDA